MPKNVCPKCGDAVYKAEEQLGAGRLWHKKCFLCQKCNKRLDSTTLAEKEGNIFCKSCYGKCFGPKGYGYGGGAGTLSMDTGNRGEVPDMRPKVGPMPVSSAYGRKNSCPRCGKAVYEAEKIVSGGQSWHKLGCFTCKDCNKGLDSTTVKDHDKEIYCAPCYGKNFGPKGFGYGLGAGALTRTQ
ncbi:cysteine and glycine-rich protein 2-like [Actinia tenebrosa]|uniref:Cysteine and glycine-rich protein 2-like n=1 Tax=Actinia tenebrosa TaxID=6105 RepID=A0A6P8HDN9_ACTTE|nr:cysteine and glycine-rich protein 2-like [Actinia tenebrosa]